MQGYDAAMIVTPYYYGARITPSVLRSHFLEVANNSPIPVVSSHLFPFYSRPSPHLSRLPSAVPLLLSALPLLVELNPLTAILLIRIQRQILYNVPPFSGITIPVDLISELSKHKNIVGTYLHDLSI